MNETMNDGMTLVPGNPLPQHRRAEPQQEHAERDSEGNLTRAGVEHVLKRGGTVLMHKVDRVVNGQEFKSPVLVTKMNDHPVFGKLTAEEIKQRRAELDRAERELKTQQDKFDREAQQAAKPPATLGTAAAK